MNKYLDCSKVYIDKSKYGLGVFAKQDIEINECIEIGTMMIMKNCDGNENPHLFTWSDDCKTWAAGSGCLPFYNYSDNPNMAKVGNLKNNTLRCIALKNIKKDDEICNRYMSKKWRKCFQNF